MQASEELDVNKHHDLFDSYFFQNCEYQPLQLALRPCLIYSYQSFLVIVTSSSADFKMASSNIVSTIKVLLEVL